MLYGHGTLPNSWSDKGGVMRTFYVSGFGSNFLYRKCRASWALSTGMLFIYGVNPNIKKFCPKLTAGYENYINNKKIDREKGQYSY
jgi:hypothetical protein